MDHLRHDQGFTIIELLIYLAVTTVAIMTITSFMVSVERYAISTKVHKAVQGNTRFVMSRISQDIRNAATPITVSAKEIFFTNTAGTAVQYSWVNDVPASICYLKICYDDGSGPLPLTSDNVRITSPKDSLGNPTNVIFKNVSGNPEEISIFLRIEQQNDAAPAFMSYFMQTQTTIVRRRSLY